MVAAILFAASVCVLRVSPRQKCSLTGCLKAYKGAQGSKASGSFVGADCSCTAVLGNWSKLLLSQIDVIGTQGKTGCSVPSAQPLRLKLVELVMLGYKTHQGGVHSTRSSLYRGKPADCCCPLAASTHAWLQSTVIEYCPSRRLGHGESPFQDGESPFHHCSHHAATKRATTTLFFIRLTALLLGAPTSPAPPLS
jgi:hypothetical protein